MPFAQYDVCVVMLSLEHPPGYTLYRTLCQEYAFTRVARNMIVTCANNSEITR